ncbi:hypothetical protein HanIR_Chr04g0190591 [Helianthus annuus]|nr:hypothetical protein HanIR_Chr04g0190591 [Helianthus annuus]
MAPPLVEERLPQVVSDVAGVRVDISRISADVSHMQSDVQWMVEAIIAMHSGVPLPPRAGAAPPPPSL